MFQVNRYTDKYLIKLRRKYLCYFKLILLYSCIVSLANKIRNHGGQKFGNKKSSILSKTTKYIQELLKKNKKEKKLQMKLKWSGHRLKN